jgi:hypothetical protein
LIQGFNLPIESFYPLDVHISEDTVLSIVGHEGYYPDVEGISSAFIYQLDLNEPSSTKETDIALSDLKFTTSAHHTGNCTFVAREEFYFDQVSITLTNHGQTKIDHVSIVPKHPYCYNWCFVYETVYYKERYNISLDPGESKDYFLGDVRIFYDKPFSDSLVCLTAVFPDLHLDTDHSDNTLCFDFLLNNDEPVEDELLAFPNPTLDRIHFRSRVSEVLVFDVSGRIITGIAFDVDHQYLDLSTLSSGVYNIVCAEGFEQKKIVRVVKM